MGVLILNQEEVERLLDMPGCMAAMERALIGLAQGEFHLPLRPVVRPPGESSFLGLMPTHRGGRRPLYALKTVAVFPDNPSGVSTRTRDPSPCTTGRPARSWR